MDGAKKYKAPFLDGLLLHEWVASQCWNSSVIFHFLSWFSIVGVVALWKDCRDIPRGPGSMEQIWPMYVI